ncbi:NAD(P)H-quinone oxidoreductase [Parafrigoribacterium mesophilum]|uniref:NAD(P)H-quinone oxidoreductase n=1 Tax=Parafrigoribacterium mesophilum TaxID=433646 RepID=UPI0031FD3355
MLAVTIPRFGSAEVLTLAELPDPVPADGELLIEVAAAGVNRSDIGQRQGSYPPPPGAPEWPGLEVSGTVAALGRSVSSWSVGDRVCALLGGGGYASLAVAPAAQVLPVPDTVDLVDAAGLPEALLTVWSNVFQLARLTAGETLLVHGGSSGIGTMAIQLARAFGARVAVTASTREKLEFCQQLGADILINYRREDFVESVLAATDGAGADVILDPIGGGYLARNLAALARRGRLVEIANQSGEPGELDIRTLMGKWASIYGTTLRARPSSEKADIVASALEQAWPFVATGQIVPVIDSRMPLAEASAAHERLESSAHIGKVLLLP